MRKIAVTPPLPVDYGAHDQMYRKLRERGATGWSTDDECAVMAKLVTPLLPPATAENSPGVLELGGGAGNFSLLLAQRGYCVTGLDISATAIDWANDRAREAGVRVDFRVDNVVELLSCSDATFDAVVDGHCLHCIIGDDRARCLQAVRRVLKPGGVFVVLTMCGEVIDEGILRQFDPVTKGRCLERQADPLHRNRRRDPGRGRGRGFRHRHRACRDPRNGCGTGRSRHPRHEAW
jgi:SAM-dependent methyltransferase